MILVIDKKYQNFGKLFISGSGLYLSCICRSPTHATQSATEHTTQKLKNTNDKSGGRKKKNKNIKTDRITFVSESLSYDFLFLFHAPFEEFFRTP
jgi:hypothetical protein